MKRLEQVLAIGSACLVMVAALPGAGCSPAEATPPHGIGVLLDQQLRQRLRSAWITRLDTGPIPSAEKVDPGQALFFDKELRELLQALPDRDQAKAVEGVS